jgi:hypothetical protein
MTPLITKSVMDLEISGLPELFEERQLRQRAQAVIADLTELLDVNRLLQFTRLTYRFRLCNSETGAPLIVLVLELAPRPQLLLNFLGDNSDPGRLERSMLTDRQRLRRACEDLPVQNSHAAIALAQRLQAVFLDSPNEALTPDTERHLAALLNSRSRQWNGHLAENHPLQLELPALPRYEWFAPPVRVRTQLLREKRGFTLKLLQRSQLPAVLHSVQSLRMHERPSTLEDAAALDRAEFTGTPIELVVRIGSLAGRDAISVADFVQLA